MTGIILDLYSCPHSDLKISLSEGHDSSFASRSPSTLSYYISRVLVITFNIYNGASIEPLYNLIVEATSNYNLRKSLNIEVPRPRTELGRTTFKHRGALCWNLLTDSFKNSSNLDSFKKTLKNKKSLLNSISFVKASCSVAFRSTDFKYFRHFILYVLS